MNTGNQRLVRFPSWAWAERTQSQKSSVSIVFDRHGYIANTSIDEGIFMADETSNNLDNRMLFTTGQKDKVCWATGIGKVIHKFFYRCLGQWLLLKLLRTLRWWIVAWRVTLSKFRLWWQYSDSGQNGNKFWCLGFYPFMPVNGSSRTCIWGKTFVFAFKPTSKTRFTSINLIGCCKSKLHFWW